MSLYHQRGPNVDNVTAKNTAVEGTRDKIMKVVTDWHVKSKTDGVVDTITLPRLSMLFAPISYAVAKLLQGKDHIYPVTENEVDIEGSSLFYPNYVPIIFADHSKHKNNGVIKKINCNLVLSEIVFKKFKWCWVFFFNIIF